MKIINYFYDRINFAGNYFILSNQFGILISKNAVEFNNLSLKAFCCVKCKFCKSQSCKSPELSRIFLLKVFIAARPRILVITSPIPIGLTPGFLFKGISLNAKIASSNQSFPLSL